MNFETGGLFVQLSRCLCILSRILHVALFDRIVVLSIDAKGRAGYDA